MKVHTWMFLLIISIFLHSTVSSPRWPRKANKKNGNVRVLHTLPNFNLKVKWQQIVRRRLQLTFNVVEVRVSRRHAAPFCSGKDSPLCRIAWGRSFVLNFRRRGCTVICLKECRARPTCFLLYSAADSLSNLLFKRICWRSLLWHSDPSVWSFSSMALQSNSLWYNPIKITKKKTHFKS